MSDPTRRIDPLSFPILGMLGVLACGPGAPQSTDSDSSPSTDSGTDPTSPGTDPTSPGTDPTSPGTDPTSPTTDPTSPGTDPTSPTTTEPPPECQSDSDCDDTYCGYCAGGLCMESPGCCGSDGAVQVAGKWRCSPPPYDYCYSDDECGFGDICSGGTCSESPAIPLPGCAPPDGSGAAWNLSNAPSAFLLIDVENDLDLDLVAAEPASGKIEIALNDGAGHFILAGAFGVGAESSGDLALAAGDLDGDGDLDLAVTRHEASGVLRLLFNDGGVFTVGDELPTAALPVQVFVGDVNSDGALDVQTVSEGQPTFGVRLGDGLGNLLAENQGTVEPIEPRAWLGDLGQDGAPDLLAPLAGGGAFMASLGGEGPWQEQLRIFPVPGASDTAALAGDLDQNGLVDLLLVHPQDPGGLAHVWAGVAATEWSTGHKRFLTTRPLTGGVLTELGALPGPDLISATGQANITVLPGDGKGGFLCEHSFDIAGSSAPALLAVGDIDGDGRPDILAGGLDLPTITVIRPIF